MEIAPAVETRRDRLTPLRRFIAAIGRLVSSMLRILVLSLVFTIVPIAAFLALDLPVRGLDHFFSLPSARPGNWLTQGHVFMTFAAMSGIFIARRFGGDEAARVITTSWGIAAVAALVEFVHLAPSLSPGDIPSARFIGAFVASAMIGQYVAVGLYDIIRGAAAWWRAPLYGLLAGYFAHVVIFFPVVYWSSGLPWTFWMVSDFTLKAVLSFGFLGLYYVSRGFVKPSDGLGG